MRSELLRLGNTTSIICLVRKSGATPDGGGVGINYFITRTLALALMSILKDTNRNFVDSAEANLILRLPLGQSGFAPYAFGGGGRQIDLTEAWFGQFGAGMEYRFTHTWVFFLDARWVGTGQIRQITASPDSAYGSLF